jgi:hypothetical protein
VLVDVPARGLEQWITRAYWKRKDRNLTKTTVTQVAAIAPTPKPLVQVDV